MILLNDFSWLIFSKKILENLICALSWSRSSFHLSFSHPIALFRKAVLLNSLNSYFLADEMIPQGQHQAYSMQPQQPQHQHRVVVIEQAPVSPKMYSSIRKGPNGQPVYYTPRMTPNGDFIAPKKPAYYGTIYSKAIRFRFRKPYFPTSSFFGRLWIAYKTASRKNKRRERNTVTLVWIFLFWGWKFF